MIEEWYVNCQRKLSGVTWSFSTLDEALQYIREQAQSEHDEVKTLNDFHVKLYHGSKFVSGF